jgi:hypothetical protein
MSGVKWKARREKIGGMDGETVSIAAGQTALTVGAVVAGWHGDAAFREFFIAELAATSYPAFFWEMPPLQESALSIPFECATIRGDTLARMRADASVFASHLKGAASVAAFPNLGGDALLIAPRQISDADCYGHIAAFLRAGPREQQHDFLRMLACKIIETLNATAGRFWISTSGLGVPWVHLRLDSYPKYYQYQRYAEMTVCQ